MSDLVAIAYPDLATAQKVVSNLGEAQKAHLIELEDVALVENRPDGKVKLHQASMAGAGAAGGALWGGLIGMLFLAPLVGMAIGAASGAAAGAASDVGVDDKFMKDLGKSLKPGGAVLFMLVVSSTPDKVIPQVAQYGGEIIKTSLSEEMEEQLRETARMSTNR
jgi:uncharacterized membrane protein